MAGDWRFDPGRARILIVDDEPTNLKLLARMLSSTGYRNLTLVQDSRKVLAEYRKQRPDLILLDLNMPYCDGFAVLRQLRELNDPLQPPVVILTAQTGRDFKLRSLTEGARDFLSKPFDLPELQARVSNLLDAHLAHLMMHDQKTVLEGLVQQRTRELRDTRLQIVRRLGRAAEYRDNETGLHIARMSRFSELIARRIGWPDGQAELILEASPMQDIGKIGIPDQVLLKPGKLTSDEFEVIKRHPVIGAELLDGDSSELLTMARVIALTHHEKWDGSGYPGGLHGEDIPLSGRIVALADVFDALTSARPYKQPWPTEKAVAHIVDNAGRHFDPELVACFRDVLPEVLEIMETLSEAEV